MCTIDIYLMDYLFIGDSIIDYYDIKNHLGIENFVKKGYPGETVLSIYYELENILPHFEPKKVFILAGTNDFSYYREIEYIKETMNNCILKIKQQYPFAEIFLLDCLPCLESRSGMYITGNRNNHNLYLLNKSYDTLDVKRIHFYDLLSENEVAHLQYYEDELHINDEGYEIISSEIKKYL